MTYAEDEKRKLCEAIIAEAKACVELLGGRDIKLVGIPHEENYGKISGADASKWTRRKQ